MTFDHFRGTNVGKHSQTNGVSLAGNTRSSLRRIEDVRVVLPGMPLQQIPEILG
jgi:hypothetical protein